MGARFNFKKKENDWLQMDVHCKTQIRWADDLLKDTKVD